MAPTTAIPTLDEAGRSLLFTDARTANTFADTPVSDAELTAIWELAKWPPTSANTQPLRVLFVRTTEGKDRLLPHMSEGNREKTAAAPVVAVLARDVAFHEFMPEVMPHREGMDALFAGNDDLREFTSEFNAALQSGYFILAVRANGLAAGPMLGFDKAGIDAEFFPDGRWKSVLVVNIGHPGEHAWFDRLPRLDPDTSVKFV